LTDEVAALTRDRGLVVLPGGEVLAFDPDRPLPVGTWLVAARVRRSEWQPFPPRPDRPDRLTTIERPAPPIAAVIEVLTGGAPDGAEPLPGDVEKALRHAPIAVPDPDAPASPIGTDARLGTRDPRYSLRDLITAGRGGAAWLGGGDVWAELAREYRRLADEAAARGDYRRA